MSTPALLWARLILVFVVGIVFYFETTGVVLARGPFESQIAAEGRLPQILSVVAPPVFNGAYDVKSSISDADCVELLSGECVSMGTTVAKVIPLGSSNLLRKIFGTPGSSYGGLCGSRCPLGRIAATTLI